MGISIIRYFYQSFLQWIPTNNLLQAYNIFYYIQLSDLKVEDYNQFMQTFIVYYSFKWFFIYDNSTWSFLLSVVWLIFKCIREFSLAIPTGYHIL